MGRVRRLCTWTSPLRSSRKFDYRWRKQPRKPPGRKLISSRRVTRRSLRIPKQPPQRLDHPHIELASRFAPELLEGFGGRTLGPIAFGPVGPAKHHVVGVHHRHYARSERYLISFEPIGVTATVRALVVMPDHRDRSREGL